MMEILKYLGEINTGDAFPENIPGKDKGPEAADVVVEDIIQVVLFVAGALAVIMLVYGGIQYIMSAGNSSKIEQAKKTIIYSVVGIIVVIISWAVVAFVTGVFG